MPTNEANPNEADYANAYSATWFNIFLRTYQPNLTALEVEFVARQLPLPAYPALLDVCCGPGRHALPLAARGYQVTGVDRDTAMVAEAALTAKSIQGQGVARFVVGDMRELGAVPGEFDAVTCLWHSFGYFDAATNAAVLRGMRDKLRPGGKLILDIYHRDWAAGRQGTEVAERGGRRIVSTRRMDGDRQTVRIEYGPDEPPDVMEWQLYTSDELRALGERMGLRLLLACSWCDEARPATAEDARMQLVFERIWPVTSAEQGEK
jgi:SAM-dependent methyltransferase